MELSVVTYKGEDTGRKVALSESVFGVEPNDHAIYLDVKQFLANNRQGTHKSKERAEITGSTRKIKKQKGTGTARAGSIKSPLFKGGGRVFGPEPRDYSFKLNKKMKQVARKSALSYKAKEASVSVVEAFDFEAPKTKDYMGFLKALELEGKKTLLVLDADKVNLVKSSNNLKGTSVTTADSLNTYELLHADNVVIVEGALEKIENTLNNK